MCAWYFCSPPKCVIGHAKQFSMGCLLRWTTGTTYQVGTKYNHLVTRQAVFLDAAEYITLNRHACVEWTCNMN